LTLSGPRQLASGKPVVPGRHDVSGDQITTGFFALKIGGDQIVRTPASANVDLGSGGAYPITVGIERLQKT